MSERGTTPVSQDRELGTVYLVGAGPGAPDLITLRAARLIAAADILFHDALVHPEVVALATHAQRIAVGKRCGRHATAQRFINKRLVDAAHAHRVIVRLKGGDPMLFGRAQEEIDALEAAGVPYQVVPGITAALASCAQIGTSLTQRGTARTVTLATPRVGAGESGSHWQRALAHADAGAIYMGVGEAAAVSASLLAVGKHADTPVVVVENASLPHARSFFTTLAELPRMATLELAGPALILVGPQFAPRTAQLARHSAAGSIAAGALPGSPFADALNGTHRRRA